MTTGREERQGVSQLKLPSGGYRAEGGGGYGSDSLANRSLMDHSARKTSLTFVTK